MDKTDEKPDYIRSQLRISPDLHRRLTASAEATGRSFNAEIVQRLEQTFVDYSDTRQNVLELLNHLDRAVSFRDKYVAAYERLKAAKAAGTTDWERPLFVHHDTSLDDAIGEAAWYVQQADNDIALFREQLQAARSKR